MGFFIPVSSLTVFGRSIHSERRMIYLGEMHIFTYRLIHALEQHFISQFSVNFMETQLGLKPLNKTEM